MVEFLKSNSYDRWPGTIVMLPVVHLRDHKKLKAIFWCSHSQIVRGIFVEIIFFDVFLPLLGEKTVHVVHTDEGSGKRPAWAKLVKIDKHWDSK